MTRFRRLRIGLLATGLLLAVIPAASAATPTTCLGVDATITGTTGDDVLIGTVGPDVILGLGGDDVIRPGEGNDIVCGGPGDDLIVGGPGDDSLLGGDGHDEISGNLGIDLVRGGTGDDTLRGGDGDDRIEAWAGNDGVAGGKGIDSICGGSGNDILSGGSGDDFIRGGTDDDQLLGKIGDDALYGDAGADLLQGGSGDDVLRGGEGDDDLRGGDDDDILLGQGGDDELTGSRHADRLDGGPGDDVIWEFRRIDTHLAEGSPDAASDVFAYSRIQATATSEWMLWQPMAGQLVQGHEGVLTITNLPDGLLMIEHIDPERYLLGIAEMPYSWQPAALESQAIAARTYLASLVANPRYGPMAEYGFDICDHAACQVYKGTKYGWLEPWEDAVVNTAGRVLLYGGAPASTFYHSTSGETTRSIQDVWTGASPIPYLQAVPVPEQNSPFATWWYKLPLDAFMEILAHDGITMDGPVELIRTIKTEPGDGPYRVRIRTLEETRDFPISTIQVALNRYAIDLYPEYIPPLHHVLGQAALSPTFTAKLRPDGNVSVNGQGWGHQIGLSQYGANALAETGSTVDDILSHFYTGLVSEDDPGLIPDLIAVGLFYENYDHPIVLSPTAGYTLRSAGGVVTTGTGGIITITRHGDDTVAVHIER